MKSKLLVILTIVVLLLSYLPLQYAASIEREEYGIDYGFFFRGNYVGSPGYVQLTDSRITIGNVNYGNDSLAKLHFIVHIFPFMNAQMKNVTEAYIIIDGDYPITTVPPTFEATEIGWKDDDFASGWEQFTKGVISVVDSVLNVSWSFTAGERAYALLRRKGLSINSTEYPYVVVRWKSTDHVARFVAYAEGEDYKVIVETPTGMFERPATDYGGAYSPDWTTTVYRLPPNKTIIGMDIGMDTGNWPSVSGRQEAYFDYVIFAQGRVEGSHIGLMMNGCAFLDEKLTYSKGAMHTIDLARYTSPKLIIPLNFDLLELDNSLTINVSSYTSWNISSATLFLRFKEPVQPLWQSIPGHMSLLFIVLVLEGAIVLVLLNQLRKWVDTFDSQVETKKTP
ncbi:MAG: hypothetical protein ACE5GD_00910 [Candidatus Geothermarchaeales archaeon]